jgi:hypothetical protein
VRHGSQFDQYLNFEGRDEIEACGPTNFSPNDVSAKITHVTITQQDGHRAEFVPAAGAEPRVTRSDPMWEVSSDRETLTAGPARAGRGARGAAEWAVVHQDVVG